MPRMNKRVYRRWALAPFGAVRQRLGALGLAVVLGLPSVAWSFGPAGHRLAGYVAEAQLCAATRLALEPLLAGSSLREAGLWPDTIRRLPQWAHTKPWHFINVADQGSLVQAAARNPDNVLSALARFEKELIDPSLSPRERGIALRFMAHFIVDLHQPLHVGRASDRGGNVVVVQVGERVTNLHALWDGSLLNLPVPPSRPGPALALGGSPWEVARWQRTTPLDWARESQVLRPVVYGFKSREGRPLPLSPAYLQRARAVVERRLSQAGVRLAGRLNRLLGPPEGCPSEVASRVPTL